MSVLIPTMIGKHHLKLDMPGEFSNKVLQKCLTTTKLAKRTLAKIAPLTENEYVELAIFAADEV